MRNRTIYLCGPMEHVSVESATGWRNEFMEKFTNNPEVSFLDPCRRIHGFDVKEMKRIFELDMRDLNECDLVVANLEGMDKVPRHGTAMEVFYTAYVLKKPVIAFRSTIPGIHPFFESLVTEWRSTHLKAAETIIDHYLN